MKTKDKCCYLLDKISRCCIIETRTKVGETTKMKNENVQKVDQSKESDYLGRLFTLLKMQDRIIFREGKSRFNNTEFRLIGEIVSAKYEGKRLISTQIAKRLGITRSAVSQIVNRLEKQCVVQRVPDDVDKKIAYIELSKGILEAYGDDLQNALTFVGNVVAQYGEERFYRLCDDFNSFIQIMDGMLKK